MNNEPNNEEENKNPEENVEKPKTEENNDNKENTVELITKKFTEEIEKLKKEMADERQKHKDEIVNILKGLGKQETPKSQEEKDVEEIINNINRMRR